MGFSNLQQEISDLKAQFDLQEVIKRAIKYLIEGICVAVAAFYIPQKQMKVQEIFMLAITAAATFAILDMYAPSIGNATRQGTGLGIGANLVGFPAVGPNPLPGPSAMFA